MEVKTHEHMVLRISLIRYKLFPVNRDFAARRKNERA